jgi:hypothetical protein
VQGVVADSSDFGICITSGTLDVQSVEIARSKGGGISVAGEATATFQSCTIHENSSYGAIVYEKSKAKFQQCLFTNHTENIALFVSTDGKARCRLCRFEASEIVHIEGRSGGIASVRDSELTGTNEGTAMQVLEQATIKLKGTHIHNCSQYAAFVGQGGIFRMSGDAIYDCAQGGMALAGSAQASFDAVQFLHNGPAAIIANEGSVMLANCSVKEHTYI